MTLTTKTQRDIQAVSSDYFAAWEAGDPERIASLHTVDTRFALHAGGDAPPVVGREAVRVAFEQVFASGRGSRSRPIVCSWARTTGRLSPRVTGSRCECRCWMSSPSPRTDSSRVAFAGNG